MPSPSQTNAAPGPQRDRAFDVLRLVAALAVIVVHSPGLDHVPNWSLPLRFAVPCFCCMAVHFAAVQYGKGRPPASLHEYFDDRFERIYRPFVTWSLLYAVVQLVAYWVGLADGEPDLGPKLFLLGGAAHLWFIPFILVAGVLTYAIMPAVSAHPAACALVASMIVAVLCAWQLSIPVRPEDLSIPEQFMARSTAIFAGIAVAALVLGLRLGRPARRWVAMAGIASFLVGSWLAVAAGGSRVMWGVALGVAAYCACLGGWRGRWTEAVGALGPYAFGVYFAHYMFVEGYEDIARKVLGLRIDAATNALLVVLSVISAVSLVWLLSRSTLTRFLVR